MSTMVMEPDMAVADVQAVERVLAARPMLTGLARAAEVLPWPDRMLLHAGPAFQDARPVLPILHSAAHAATLEGWAKDFDAAMMALAHGDIRLAPAQDWGCVVPLAAVLSPSQWVQVVEDVEGRGARCLAPLNGGVQHAPRLGMADGAALDFLRWQNGAFAQHMAQGTGSPIDLLAIADQALSEGDDCHGRTVAGTRLLVKALRKEGASFDADESEFLARSGGFFLSTWMAASYCMLSAADGVAGSSVVVGMGANGVRIGLRLAGAPRTWVTVPATPPRGNLLDGIDQSRCLPAIGDSAVVEALGLGAMAMHHAPAQQAALQAFMPRRADALAASLLAAHHPGFSLSAARMVLPARRVEPEMALPVALGILDQDGQLGRIGGEIFLVGHELFENAISRLS